MGWEMGWEPVRSRGSWVVDRPRDEESRIFLESLTDKTEQETGGFRRKFFTLIARIYCARGLGLLRALSNRPTS